MTAKKHWFDPYLRRGTGIPLAAQEKHLEQARAYGVRAAHDLTEMLRLEREDPAAAAIRWTFMVKHLDLACRSAFRARPDLKQD